MKKLIAGAVLLSVASVARAEWYATMNVGVSKADLTHLEVARAPGPTAFGIVNEQHDTNAAFFGLGVGYQFSRWGLELAYNEFGNVGTQVTENVVDSGRTPPADLVLGRGHRWWVTSFSLSGLYSYPIARSWHVIGKGSMHLQQTEFTSNSTETVRGSNILAFNKNESTQKSSDLALGWGLGVSHEPAKFVRLTALYETIYPGVQFTDVDGAKVALDKIGVVSFRIAFHFH
jgi:opacity protein-like surface antigen